MRTACIAGWTLGFAAFAACAQSPDAAAERGRKLYLDNWCHSCHGTVGQGGERGAGPRIAPKPFPYEAFAMQTRRPRGTMPRYPAEFLSDRDLADIYAYVASIKRAPAAEELMPLRD